MKIENIKLEVDTAKAIQRTLSSVPLRRIQTIRVLQLIALLASFIGGADFLNLLAIFPPETSKWLILTGPTFAASVKPIILLIGDYMDNGTIDKSFKLDDFDKDPEQGKLNF